MRKTSRKTKGKTKRTKSDPLRTLVKAANRLKDPTKGRELGFKYTNKDLNLQIKYMRILDKDLLEWAFQLTKTNMRTLYDECEWGWDDDEKLSQLQHKTARFLIATDEHDQPKAFVHLRFDMDFGVPVVYCYEIQLESDVQRKGVGKYLMNLLLEIGEYVQMKKVVLTVLKHNKIAYNFYTKICGFKIDETSPGKVKEEACYEILSKECQGDSIKVAIE